MVQNYISITAARDEKEVNAVLDAFQSAGFALGQNHTPVIGVQVSENTLNGITPKNYRFPKFNEIPSLIRLMEGKAMPVIHYNTKNVDNLFEQVEKTMSSCDCRTVQLNTTWPDIAQVEKIKQRFDGIKIILQLNYKGMEVGDAVDKIVSYGTLLDYILLDPSRGGGHMFDMETSAAFYSELKSRYGIVFAGGFGPDTAEPVLNELIDRIKTKDISICAEGRLRDKVSDEYWGQDILNIDKLRDYLQIVKRIIS
jgi:hypothetical protein